MKNCLVRYLLNWRQSDHNKRITNKANLKHSRTGDKESPLSTTIGLYQHRSLCNVTYGVLPFEIGQHLQLGIRNTLKSIKAYLELSEMF